MKDGKKNIPEWHYKDNGFNSNLAMDIAHKPILDLVSLICKDHQDVNILDLGCGNGILLKKIKQKHPFIIPFGIDHNPIGIVHAKIVLPDFKDNFIIDDIFNSTLFWNKGLHFKIILLMPGRLLECNNLEKIHWLKKKIQNNSDNLLVYAYGDWLIRYRNIYELTKKIGIKLDSARIHNHVSVLNVNDIIL